MSDPFKRFIPRKAFSTMLLLPLHGIRPKLKKFVFESCQKGKWSGVRAEQGGDFVRVLSSYNGCYPGDVRGISVVFLLGVRTTSQVALVEEVRAHRALRKQVSSTCGGKRRM